MRQLEIAEMAEGRAEELPTSAYWRRVVRGRYNRTASTITMTTTKNVQINKDNNFHFPFVISSCSRHHQPIGQRFKKGEHYKKKKKLSRVHLNRGYENALLSTASVASAPSGSGGGLVVHGALGVGAQVLEGVLGRVLGVLGAAGDALIVGVGGGCAGLGGGLALGLGGLAALVGSRHCCGCVVCWGGVLG